MTRRHLPAFAAALGLLLLVAACAADDPDAEHYEELAREAVQQVDAERAEEARLMADPDDGTAEAQYRLARHYELGRGVPVDLQKAVFFYERAAARDEPNAIVRLALAMSGLEIPELASGLLPVDHRRAAELYRRAEKLGVEACVPDDCAAYVALIDAMRFGWHTEQTVRTMIDTLDESPDGVPLPQDVIVQRLEERVAQGDADAAWRLVAWASDDDARHAALARAEAMGHPFAMLIHAEELQEADDFAQAVKLWLQADARFTEMYGPRSYIWLRSPYGKIMNAAGDRPLPAALFEIARCCAVGDGSFFKDTPEARQLFALALDEGFMPTDADLDALVPEDVLPRSERDDSIDSEDRRLSVLTDYGGRSPAMHRRLADRFLALHARAQTAGWSDDTLERLFQDGHDQLFAAAQLEGWQSLDAYGQRCVADEDWTNAIRAYDAARDMAQDDPEARDAVSALARQAGSCRVRLGASRLPSLYERAQAALDASDFTTAAAAATEIHGILDLSVEVGEPIPDAFHQRLPALLTDLHDGTLAAAPHSLADRFLLGRLRAQGLGCAVDRAAARDDLDAASAEPSAWQDVASVDAAMLMLVEWPAASSDAPVPSGWLLDGPDALADGVTPNAYFVDAALQRAGPPLDLLRSRGTPPELVAPAQDALRADRAAVAHRLDHLRAQQAASTRPVREFIDDSLIPPADSPELLLLAEYEQLQYSLDRAEEDKQSVASQTVYREREVYKYEGIFHDQTVTQGGYVSIWSDEDERLYQARVDGIESRMHEIAPQLPRLIAAREARNRACAEYSAQDVAAFQQFEADTAEWERRATELWYEIESCESLLRQMDAFIP
ncbi:MAG: SEL1-like repeat protein [Planctomycetes bacterium]|nr:SEL1-like repeat protein [Planctomycetota bacterium]